MPPDADHYEDYYAEKLWRLLPEVYRADDTDELDPQRLDAKGPLRELVERIGVQAAIVRRSIDRLWEDQSIETCDDWLIPYIGDLLATNLVASLDARGQRLDVARTIYYRRRKGTVSLLEELAANITGWDARVVELFRRLGRTRHGFDPQIGYPAATTDPIAYGALQRAEQLVGLYSGTPMGGLADLRDVYGASRTGTAFDESFHTADVRRGRQATGWYGIPKLGVFLWRLWSFAVPAATPVPCPANQLYTFDPTGRLEPLFARKLRTRTSYGDAWVSPAEWQLPGPVSTPLYEKQPDDLYPASFAVLRLPPAQPLADVETVARADVTIHPELGTFRNDSGVAQAELLASYHYGFPAEIGAGPYDRRTLGLELPAAPTPEESVELGQGLPAALGNLDNAGTGTVTIVDSLTYDAVADVGTGTPIASATIRSGNRQRPLIRLDGGEWALTGQDGELVLDGLFLSGADLVLRGSFRSVTIACSTLDPGTSGGADQPPAVFRDAVDGRPLRPSRLIVEAHVEQLVVARSILGGLRTRNGGEIEHASLSDSILQGIRTSDLTGAVPRPSDPTRLFARLARQADPLSAYLHGQLPQSQADVDAYGQTPPPAGPPDPAKQDLLDADLDALVTGGTSLYDPARFADVSLSDSTLALAQNPQPADLVRLNRLLLEEAFPVELGDLALALGDGEVSLERCTVLGRAYAHRLKASECILHDTFLVEDLQHGCVRFTAFTDDSVLPRKYEWAETASRPPIFASTSFGDPHYAQLLPTCDQEIVDGPALISAGGPAGSEFGAYASELGPVKERSLLIKFDEYMPIGLSPVVVYVT